MASSEALHNAANALRAGGVVAYPTEAVFGLGCDPHHEAALQQILTLKKRTSGMGVILIASSIEQFSDVLVGLTEAQLQPLNTSWPGPNTWIVPHNGTVPDWISGGRDTVALRVTNHPVAAALCEAFGGAIVSTSANPHGEPAARDGDEVAAYFPQGLAEILAGQVDQTANASTIRHLITGEMIRA
jgi:L-threonylcarbamoyladenylate synthase